MFDIDNSQGPPLGTGLFRREGEHVVCYRRRKLRSPANDGRALLVPTGAGGPAGYFAFRRGKPFRWVEGAVPSDLGAGRRRAQTRLTRLLDSMEAGALDRRGVGTVLSNVRQTVIVRPFSMAA